MVLEYFNNIRKGKQAEVSHSTKSPILNEEDERFLTRITSTSEETPPPLPERPVVILDNGKKLQGKDAQTALMDGADTVPLPTSPPVEGELKEGKVEPQDTASVGEDKKKRDYWSFLPSAPSLRFSKVKRRVSLARSSLMAKKDSKEQTASDLKAAAEAVKKGEGVEVKGTDAAAAAAAAAEVKNEEDDLTTVLDQLNLSAVNNRVFSFSKESQKLMEEFTQILKDLVNGVPTAYDDLEKLLTRSEGQLTKMFAAMPPFLQTLVKSLPTKMTSALGPEFLAAASEKPGADAQKMGIGASSVAEGKKKLKRSGVPSLKTLVSKKGAVVTMLRSILNFLKLRFPAFMTGTNVLMSLAVFLLLFVFWYCHKRGRETRLEKERLAAESDFEKSASDLEDSDVFDKTTDKTEPPIILSTNPAIEEKPSAALEDLSVFLDQPPPVKESLPSPEVDKVLVEQKK